MRSRVLDRMTNPCTSEGEWLRCALHAHTTTPTASSPREARRALRAAATTCSRSPTTGSAREAPSTDRCSCMPSAELNCFFPRRRDGHVLGVRDRGRPAALGGEYADLAAHRRVDRRHGGVAYLAHPVLDGRHSGHARAAGEGLRDRGLQRRLRARGGAGALSVHWDELLETGRRCFALATDDSHHPGFDSDHALDVGARARAKREAVLAALAPGCFYGSTGPLITTCVDGGRGRGALQPCPLGHPRPGRSRERP